MDFQLFPEKGINYFNKNKRDTPGLKGPACKQKVCVFVCVLGFVWLLRGNHD